MKKIAWDTLDELRFIARLGHHSLHGPQQSHHDWLRRYQRTLPLRKNWDAIDRDAVTERLNQEIAA